MSTDLGELVSRMAQGDQVALANFYEATKRRAYGLVLGILRDSASAEEATLDAYQQVWREAARFDASRGSPLPWLLMIARSRALDLRRSRKRIREEALAVTAVLADARPGPGEASETAEVSILVRAAVAALPEEQRLAVETAFFRGLSYAETAEALGQPTGTVKTRIRAAMGALRHALSGVTP